MSGFGTAIKRRRQALGLSQRAVSDASGVPQSVISLVESGAREATPPVRSALLVALAARPSAVLPKLRQQALDIVARHGGSQPRLFGSTARGDDQPRSDVDLLVHFESGRSILDLLAMQDELAETLTFDVDVVSDAGDGVVVRQARTEAVPL